MPVGLGTDFRFINELTRSLLAHGRTNAAVDLLALYSDRTEPPAEPSLIADALDGLIEAPGTDIQIAPYHLRLDWLMWFAARRKPPGWLAFSARST